MHPHTLPLHLLIDVSSPPNDEYPKGMWFKLEVQCKERSARIQEFRGGLEGVETQRSDVVGKKLRRLVDDMVSTAYRMPDEIERIVEVQRGVLTIEFRRQTEMKNMAKMQCSSNVKHARKALS